MYQTPAAHRIMEKEVISVDNKPTLAKTSDRHFVIVRPKAYVDSSGSSWASEIVKLRAIEPDVFEVPDSGENVSSKVRTYVSLIHDSVFQYYDMTEQEGFGKIKSEPTCPFQQYELKRVNVLQDRVTKAAEEVEIYRGI